MFDDEMIWRAQCKIGNDEEGLTVRMDDTSGRVSVVATTPDDLRASKLSGRGYYARELRNAGASSKGLRLSGFWIHELREGGYPASELRSDGLSATALRNAGYSAESLRDAGYSIDELRIAGCSSTELDSAGYLSKVLLGCGLCGRMRSWWVRFHYQSSSHHKVSPGGAGRRTIRNRGADKSR